MKNQKRNGIIILIILDFLTAMLAWAFFFIYRKYVENGIWDTTFLEDVNFYKGIIVIPIGWILIYAIFDSYRDLYRMSRLSTLANTFFISFLGVLFLFFALVLDDIVRDYRTYYKSFLVLFSVHFLLTSFARMIILTWASRRLKSGLITYNTLIVGGDIKALDLFQEITAMKRGLGNNFLGFIDTNGKSTNVIEEQLPKLGTIEDLKNVIRKYEIEEVIIAIETSEHGRLRSILNDLFDFGNQILVKIIPDMYDILLGSVKMNHVYGAVLIEIEQELMPRWQWLIKRLIDILVSAITLILLIPLIIYVIIRVRLSSPGPILFAQERVGKNGNVFNIYKFRSMYIDAEENGPMLSHENDKRCTPWGAVMRKWRLDEIPQFYNVLRGEMSLVGPRPERQYFIDQIVEHAPYYRQLLKVQPGITSWGQVKYGYASSIDEMLQRLRFDILYIENMSLALDLKIMFYTLLVLLQGKGK